MDSCCLLKFLALFDLRTFFWLFVGKVRAVFFVLFNFIVSASWVFFSRVFLCLNLWAFSFWLALLSFIKPVSHLHNSHFRFCRWWTLSRVGVILDPGEHWRTLSRLGVLPSVVPLDPVWAPLRAVVSTSTLSVSTSTLSTKYVSFRSVCLLN